VAAPHSCRQRGLRHVALLCVGGHGGAIRLSQRLGLFACVADFIYNN
jgi:hypothetical protein